jgi:CHAT domain-containing protein/Tfp pilus assembly protein PilF
MPNAHKSSPEIRLRQNRILEKIFLLALFFASSTALPIGAQAPLEGQFGRPQKDQPPTRLARGTSIDGRLEAGRKDRYQVALDADEYVRVVLKFRDFELLVRVLGADRKQIMKLDTSETPGTSVSMSWIARQAGVFEVELASSAGGNSAGSYAIEMDEMRPATEQDRTRSMAQGLFLQAEELRRQGTEVSQRAALKLYDQSISLWRQIGEGIDLAETLNKSGVVNSALGENKKGAEVLDQALRVAQHSDDSLEEAAVLHNLGEVAYALSEKQKALECFRKALDLRKGQAGFSREADTLNDIGAVLDDLGEKSQALDYYNQALNLKRRVGDHQSEASILNNMGVLYDDLGEKQMALQSYLAALPAMSNARDRDATLGNIGKVYEDTGQTQKALQYYQQSLIDAKGAGDRLQQARTLSSIGALYIDVGDDSNALDYLNQALPLRRSTGDRHGEAYTLRCIARVLLKRGQYQEALDFLNQSLALSKAASDRKQQAMAYQQAGNVYSAQGNVIKALDCLNQALSISDSIGDRFRVAAVLNDLGELHWHSGEAEAAFRDFERARSLALAVTDPDTEAIALQGMARAEQQLGRLEDALIHVDESLSLVESLRSNISGGPLRTTFLAARQKPFQLAMELLMQMHVLHPDQGYDARAFEVSERARARGLIDLLGEAGAEIRQGVEPVLLERERRLQSLVTAKSSFQVRLEAESHTIEQVTKHQKEMADLIRQYDEVEAEIRANSPRYAALTQPEPLKLSGIQQQVLDPDTVLLEYRLGESHSYLWVVTPRSFTSVELPSRAEIESAARVVYELLRARNQSATGETAKARQDRQARAAEGYSKAAAHLSGILVGPVAKLLIGKRLLIVADGALQYLPFGALPVPGDNEPTEKAVPLMAEHEVVCLPSASVIAVLRRDFANRPIASMAVAVLADPVFETEDPRVENHKQPRLRPARTLHGDPGGSDVSSNSLQQSNLARSATDVGLKGSGSHWPRLLFTRREAKGILALSPPGEGMEALDFKANRTTATSQELANYRIIHFATHGLLDSEHPELSGLVLSLVNEKGEPENGFVQLEDVYNLSLKAELVVLSACETGLGEEVKGEGLIGLTRGFMYAGSPRVVASLWKVDDVATAELMQRFYRGMLKEGQRPVAALRQAQLEMWKQKRWADPYYWAAFTIQGEWR